MAKIIAVIGSTGHFGKIIFDHLFENLGDCRFYLLSRTSPQKPDSRIAYFYYDYKIEPKLPDFPVKPDLLLDLSGPVAEDSPVVLEACIQAGIPCMDISMDIHRITNSLELLKKHKKGFALVHTGLFPGFSNLLIADLIRELPGDSGFILASEFPAYASGGYKVAQTLANLLENYSSGYYFAGGKKILHALHEGPVKVVFNGKLNKMFRWFLPEMTSLEHSLQPRNFSRLVIIKPEFINRIFVILVKLLHIFHGSKLLINCIKWPTYLLKKYVYKIFSPAITIEAIGIQNNSEKRIILNVKNAVQFHGNVMLGFVEAYMKLQGRKNLSGIFTPEQLFKTGDVLKFGRFKDYSLNRFHC